MQGRAARRGHARRATAGKEDNFRIPKRLHVCKGIILSVRHGQIGVASRVSARVSVLLWEAIMSFLPSFEIADLGLNTAPPASLVCQQALWSSRQHVAAQRRYTWW